MQIISSRTHFIEKIVRNSDGRLVRVKFCVYENGGRIKARVVSADLIEESISSKNILFISGFARKTGTFIDLKQTSAILSPYIYSHFLYALGSKPRAPTF